ncbi:anti-sigma-F factor Fin family protein [Bythopirellula goksoeyrii]|uniref:Uncharacterized protein n=1 Tax=Bythopirellula goksoeyrii TaxID=1400387 RepID=A0A5B9QEJ7_9BACT|nr:anti-sigma-F factor Fin family protein [Bythopirellula goksoeyrii]QEG37467.1 hypothetical protein Pr1d_48130 [Bythopirellula goksoeyrii]
MSHDPIDEIIKRFDQLTDEQRGELISELEHRQVVHSNGNAKTQSILEALQRRGLIGSISGEPADWSTNPDYLDGFGKNSDAQ